MATWADFATADPTLASAIRALVCQYGPGLGYLATIRPCLDSIPSGADVVAERYVGGIVDNTSDFILLQPGILGDYSVGPAVYLTMPEHRDLRITARAAVDLPRYPRAMRADCGQNSDASWHVTGIYDL